MKKMLRAIAVAPMLLPLGVSDVRSQTVPDVTPLARTEGAEALRERRDLRGEAGRLDEGTELRFTYQVPPANAEQIVFFLEDLVTEGGSVYSAAEIDALFAERLGREISLADVFEMAGELQTRYREDGYVFTRVVVPAQRIEGGVVRLEIVEAVLTRVEIEAPEGELGPVEALARRFVEPLQGLENPHIGDIERVLLLLNDIPGIERAAAIPSLASEIRGGVELYVNMEREALELSLLADNRQSPLVGRGLIGAIGSFNSWSPYGDSTTVSLFNSAGFDDPFPDDFKERSIVVLEHTHFLGGSGARLEFDALYSDSNPGDVLADFDIQADQFDLGLSAHYPLARRRALSAEVYGGFVYRHVTQDDVIDDRLNVLFAGAETVLRDALGFTQGSVEFRAGLPGLGASEDGDANLSRPDADGQFFSVQGLLERTTYLDDRRSLWVAALGQYADGPLLSVEETAFGVGNFARAYHPSEISGDVGIGVAAELRHTDSAVFQGVKADYELYGFADFAEVRNLDGGSPEHSSLVSAGAGVRVLLPRDLAVNLEAAKPINEPLSYDQSNAWRFLFSVSKEF